MVVTDGVEPIRISLHFLQGCHNCTWHNERMDRCVIEHVMICEWENDGTYEGASWFDSIIVQEEQR